MLVPTDNSSFNTLTYSHQQRFAFQQTTVQHGSVTQQREQGYSESYRVSLNHNLDVSYTYASVKQTSSIQAISVEEPLLAGASRILGFVSNRLAAEQAEGASLDELRELLDRGWAGFEQGFSEAASMLSGAGELPGAVNETVATLYEQVLDGFDDLREQYFGEGARLEPVETAGDDDLKPITPPPGTGVAGAHGISAPISSLAIEPLNMFGSNSIGGVNQNILSSLIDDLAVADDRLNTVAKAEVEYGRKDRFSFELTTLDGDKIKIQASQTSVYFGEYQLGERHESLAASKEKSQFTLSVEGELDEGELTAIHELFDQVISLAKDFYAGDLDAAYEAALDVGYDHSEIAAYSLRLHQTQQATVTAQYEALKPSVAPVEPVVAQVFEQLGHYTSRLLESLMNPENYRVVDYRELIESLSEQLDQSINAKTKVGFNGSVNGVLNYLERVGL